VAVFTAGYEWFADPIIDFIDPKKKFIQHRYFRHHCSELETDTLHLPSIMTKDLKLFKGVDINKMLIIDNMLYSFALNPENGIPILDFMGNKKDVELLKIMRYLDHIKSYDDLRA